MLLHFQKRLDDKILRHLLDGLAHGLLDAGFFFAVPDFLHDVRILFQRQEVEIHVNDILRLLHRLRLGNPQGGFRNGYGEVVYLYAVELPDGDLNRVVQFPQHDFHAKLFFECLVFEAAK